MVADEPTLESFKDELDQVIARHNELAQQQSHGLLAAALGEAAGDLAYERNVDVDVQHHEHDGQPFTIVVYDGFHAALFGLQPGDADPSVVADALGGTVGMGVSEMVVQSPSAGGGRDE